MVGAGAGAAVQQNRFHYNWHWNWEYGCGDMGNQGVHEMDIARWGLGVTLPTKITAVGGHFMFDDAQETPNVLMALFRFPNPKGGGDKKKILQFEVRHWIANGEDGMWLKGAKQGNTYMATSGGNVTETCSSARTAIWPRTLTNGRPLWAKSASRGNPAPGSETTTRIL